MKPLNILLADDDKDDRFFFQKALDALDIQHHFATVEDGEKLMTHLKKNAKSLPDVLFLDLNMPRKNGTECLSEIKLNAKLKGLPVVIYSTSLHKEIADQLHKTGAHYYIQKDELDKLIKMLTKTFALLKENGKQPGRDKFVISDKK